MFGFFKKKKIANPISDIFRDLSVNQKMSVLNMLVTIAFCETSKVSHKNEIQILRIYEETLDLRGAKHASYLDEHGTSRIIKDLQTISQSKKQFLVVVAGEMIHCDGAPSENKTRIAAAFLENIGIPLEEFVEIIEKAEALKDKFLHN